MWPTWGVGLESLPGLGASASQVLQGELVRDCDLHVQLLRRPVAVHAVSAVTQGR